MIDPNTGINSGAAIYTAIATDSDWLAGTKPHYRLKPGEDSALFKVNSETGELSILTSPDYESDKKTYKVTVIYRL